MSLLQRLMLLVFLALVPAAAIEIDNELQLRAIREAEVHQVATRLVSLIDAEQSRIVEGVRQVLVTVAQTDAVRSGDAGRCNGLMERLRPGYPDHLQVHVTDGDGVIRCATDEAAIGLSVADRAHLRIAAETGRFAVGEHIRRRTTGAPALPFALPYTDRDGAPAGMVTALLDLGWLESYLKAKPMPHNAAVLVTDRNGVVLARVPQIAGVNGTQVPERYRPLITARESGTVEMPGLDAVERILAYSPVDVGAQGLLLAVGIDKAQAMAPIDRAMRRALAVIAAVAAVTLLGAWWIAGRLVRRPVSALVEATRRWRAGDLTARSGLTGTATEFGQIGDAFDAMAEDLERKARAQEEANAAAHKMAAVLASTTDGVFEVDRTFTILYLNHRARALIANGRDLVGKRLWDAFPDAVGSVFHEQYTHALREQEPAEFEGYFAPLDAWFAVRAFPSRDGLAVFFQDVTARKRDEAALVEANRENGALLGLLNSLLEHAPVGFAFFDREHRYLRINRTLADIHGVPAEAYLGRRVVDALPVNASQVDRIIEQVFATGEPVRSHEMVGEVPHQPGVRRHWLTSFYPVKADGMVVAVGVVVMEVSDLREAEAARSRSEERFRSVFEQASVGIERVALDGRLLEVNGKACAILGTRREDLLGRSFRDVTDPADLPAEEALLDRLLAGDIPSYAIEKRYRRADGSPVWVRVTSSLARVTGTEEAYRLSIVEDITERTAIEGDLKRAKEEAELANLAKTKFLAAASHDLRQPLQSLFFFAAALGNHVSSERGGEVLGHLERGLEALKGLLDSLLDVSRLDAGLVTPEVEDFPITDVLDLVSAAYAPLAHEKRLGWRVDGCAATVRSDRTLLARMLRNLVENALRYTAAGEVAIECRASASALLLCVRDTGVGIPADHMERIFEEFHQVGNPERDRTQGLGLGLAIVRRLSRLLRHPVTVRSTVGGGSEFCIAVPIGQTAEGEQTLPAEPAAPSGRGRLAMLVDDDAIVLMGLKLILAEWGYEVMTAGSADQAMERLEEEGRRPDIVVADYRLREGRVGTEAILRVRERYGAAIPGVILTGETGPECQHDAATHGLRVVHKPVTPRQLGTTLDEQLQAAE
ncbi:PAS domain S-box protein [Azospirillum sp.]|uniref:PAS domain S-box protein n=1 Tax=Azospirillum sp. TaxID=34012 RepID=UPI002D731B7D|nr:PAS domain S-box protein [Azospirillum sp.]HYD69654.1 PAS domain S-box protein [Azospirillum sp.]